MGTTLARKAWRDLGRRRARTLLTSATIALAVAGMGLLAVPTLIDRTMSAEVRDTQLYDITLPVRDLQFDDETRQELVGHPQRGRDQRPRYVLHPSARRRPPHPGDCSWASRTSPEQPIDVVRVTSGAVPTDGQVLADDGNAAAVDVDLAAGDQRPPHRRRRFCRGRSRCPERPTASRSGRDRGSTRSSSCCTRRTTRFERCRAHPG